MRLLPPVVSSLLPALLLGSTVASCGGPSTFPGRVAVDTLPNGATRVISDAPVGWPDTTGWRLIEVTHIAGGEGPGELQVPNDATVDAEGRVYVAERIRPVIKVYRPDGGFLRTIGREGEGPGEFERAFLAIAGGQLYVHDPRSSRTSLFDTAGVFQRGWPSFCCVSTAIDVDSAGEVEVPGPPPAGGVRNDRNSWQRTVRWYRPDSTVSDTALVPAGPDARQWTVVSGGGKVAAVPIPFQPQMTFTYLPDHRLVSGVGDRYLLAITRDGGTDTIAVFGRHWDSRKIPATLRSAAVTRLVEEYAQRADPIAVRNAVRLDDVPSSAPAFDWIGVDARGDLWTRTPDPADTDRVRFDVFDPRLRWLGQVAGSGSLQRGEIKLIGDRLLSLGEDEAGGPTVIVYRIAR